MSGEEGRFDGMLLHIAQQHSEGIEEVMKSRAAGLPFYMGQKHEISSSKIPPNLPMFIVIFDN